MRKVLLGISLALISVVITPQANPHWKPGTVHQQHHAIANAFCGSPQLNTNGLPSCRYGREAIVVARLESGAFHWFGGHCARAINGQYIGCFQMGNFARSTYGHGVNVWGQARAAWRYFKASGYDWSPWSCKPWGVCY